MAYEENVQGNCVGSLTAAADLSGSQFCFVKVTGVSAVNTTTAATDFACGVLQNKPTSGQSAQVGMGGISKVKVGGAVTAGDRLTSDATGRAITTVTAGNRYTAIALETATTANQLIAAMLVNGTI